MIQIMIITYLAFALGIVFGGILVSQHYRKRQRNENERLNKIGVFRREDVSEEFLKTIDGIEENLKRKK